MTKDNVNIGYKTNHTLCIYAKHITHKAIVPSVQQQKRTK